MEDRKIIELYNYRSENALIETDKKYGKIVTFLICKLIKNTLDVEECRNDTYLGAWMTIPPIIPDNLKAYLLKIARNQALKKYEYAVNQIIEKTTLGRGTIDYTDSTLSIVARTYNVYEEDKVRKQGLLDGITWEQFKEQNRDNVQLDVPADLYQMVSTATGFTTDNITILAYRVPQFVDAEAKASKGFTDYLPIMLAVVIFGLLAFVVFKSTRPVEVLETEPELSVEALLASTKENQQSVEDIDLNDKSETRKAIEKFVDENPEAVALLLRNWLEDDWN